ncbi:hypothetical protein PH210_27765 [Paenibacillus sp. BSR1-1]|uniref:hypothetical protein n=1 Tax=Paenibacillus sp. BSR1-1 TaxID=3020845 RepID=UPI0025B09345|nr:hypothetical protein [Paenibacillus sp. BSR1-1]MDN3017145.1 hypothetical protein [Paenibacillus sp. BSR1-1]MDN3019943.1 hypothetical protein [Paenibacillus sp. BSR1-1]
MKLNKINVLGWFIIIFLGISEFFFKEELSMITSGLGGLICVIIGSTLIFYKGKKGTVKH